MQLELADDSLKSQNSPKLSEHIKRTNYTREEQIFHYDACSWPRRVEEAPPLVARPARRKTSGLMIGILSTCLATAVLLLIGKLLSSVFLISLWTE